MLIAADTNDRRAWADHAARLHAGIEPVTTAPVVAQVSRSPHQAQLRRFLRGCRVDEFSAAQAHQVGSLLAAAGTSDVVDAHLALVASNLRATVWTSDPDDLDRLGQHTEARIETRRV